MLEKCQEYHLASALVAERAEHRISGLATWVRDPAWAVWIVLVFFTVFAGGVQGDVLAVAGSDRDYFSGGGRA